MSSNVPAAALEHEDMTVTVVPIGGGQFKATPVSDANLLTAVVDQQAAAVVAEEEDQGTFFDAIGLSSGWTYAPLIGLMGAKMISMEWYVLNNETFIAGCLTGAGFIAWVNLREPVGKWYEGEAKAILDAQNVAEQKHIAACQTFVSRAAGSPTLQADIDAAFADRANLVTAEAAAKAHKEKEAVRESFIRKLEQMVNVKADAENQMFKDLLAEAEVFVAKAAQDDKFKKKALAYAVAAITDPTKAGEDPAGDLYKQFFASKGMAM